MSDGRRVVSYAAKSTADPHGSIPSQLEDCRIMAEREGWRVVGEYSDEAFSAFHGDRGPGLAAAMVHCQRVAPCALIVQHSDRLARGDAKQARHLIEVVLWALKHDVELLSVQDPGILAGGDMALLMGAVGGMRNHEDSKRKSEAVKGGLKRRAKERGQLAGGPRPYGYRWQGAKGEKLLVIDPAEAEVVKRVFGDTIGGVSQRSLARQLSNERVPTVHGGPWVQATVARILANPIYKGLIRHADEEYPSAYATIISTDVWEQANAIRVSSARKKGGRWPKGKHLLTKGIFRCGRCGYAMTPRTDPYRTRQDGRTYEIYECSGRRQRGVEFCAQGSLHRSVVDLALLEDLTSHWFDLAETRRRIERRVAADLVLAREELTSRERDERKAQDAIARIERDYIDGKITAEQWNRLESKLATELQAAVRAAHQARERVRQVEQATTHVDGEDALLRHLAAIREAVADGLETAPDLDALRHTIGQLFDRIELLPAPLIDSMARDDGIYLVPHLSPNFPDRAVLPVSEKTVRKGLVT